ncbi:peptidylprolyl isomerase [Candidatus Binatia bacterium]|jgi:peptidyl-prolyl cis-trans isomerase C|nr:peptidylprolyl isomerase [Candidatus Binatia bacterium]
MLARISLCLGLIAGFVLGGCDRGGPPPAPPAAPQAQGAPAAPPGAAKKTGEVVARYGDGQLTSDELIVELQRLPARSRATMDADARKRFIENYVLNDLLYQEGVKQGLADDPDIERQVSDLRRRLVVQRVVKKLQDLPPVTDEQVKAYYDANGDKYSSTTIKARHILVKDEAKARELQAQLKQAPDQFADVAKANSVDTASARKGGDLGFFGRGRMVPEFEVAAFALKTPSEVSEVVKTPYGFHIIQLEERRDGEQKPFDQVKEQIRATLRNEEMQAKTKEYYDQLKQSANLQIDDAAAERVAASIPEPSPGAAPVMPVHGGH